MDIPKVLLKSLSTCAVLLLVAITCSAEEYDHKVRGAVVLES
jgi:hypothetical protein